MTRFTVFAMTLTLTAFAAAPTGGSSRLTMQVSPTLAYAPARLWVYTRVESNKENRAIEIIAESEDFYRSSEIELDGDRAPLRTTFEFRGLPAGDYDVKAVLKGAGGRALEVAATQVRLFEATRTDR
jgi:hypothetical protein